MVVLVTTSTSVTVWNISDPLKLTGMRAVWVWVWVVMRVLV